MQCSSQVSEHPATVQYEYFLYYLCQVLSSIKLGRGRSACEEAGTRQASTWFRIAGSKPLSSHAAGSPLLKLPANSGAVVGETEPGPFRKGMFDCGDDRRPHAKAKPLAIGAAVFQSFLLFSSSCKIKTR